MAWHGCGPEPWAVVAESSSSSLYCCLYPRADPGPWLSTPDREPGDLLGPHPSTLSCEKSVTFTSEDFPSLGSQSWWQHRAGLPGPSPGLLALCPPVEVRARSVGLSSVPTTPNIPQQPPVSSWGQWASWGFLSCLTLGPDPALLPLGLER